MYVEVTYCVEFFTNIKELKDLSLKKLMFITTSFLIFVYLIRKTNASLYAEILKTISEWSNNDEGW